MSDKQRAAREAVLAAVATPPPRRPNRNPAYKPNPQYSKMALLTGYCQSINEQSDRLGPDYIVGGFVNYAMKAREIARVEKCTTALGLFSP